MLGPNSALATLPVKANPFLVVATMLCSSSLEGREGRTTIAGPTFSESSLSSS